MEMIKHYKISVSGKVQGVFFRKYTQEKAQQLGLSGFVRNQPDGSVYIEAEGEEDVLKTFVEWCRKGPPAAVVSKISTEESDLVGFDGFGIRRGA